MKKSLYPYLMIGLAILIILFLVIYKENLHCTQYTSFAIAVFDSEAHIEECFPPKGPLSCPLIYQPTWSIPLRIFFAVNLLLFLFFPIISSILQYKKKVTKKFFYISNILIMGLFIASIHLSSIWAGERFSSLNLASLFIGIFSFCIILLINRFTKNTADIR